MSKKITITLEFKHDDTTREEIKRYLKDLIEGDELQWEDANEKKEKQKELFKKYPINDLL